MPVPRIETSRLLLRPVIREDIDDLHNLWTEAGMRKYLWDDQIISREMAAEVVEGSIESFKTHGFGFWRISWREGEDRLIGFCGLRHFQDEQSPQPEVEILYGIDARDWNRGLASEAAHAVLAFGFEQLGLERIYAGADPPNVASIKVMEKLGLGFARRTRVNGLTTIYSGISREDFLDRRAD